jgi:hypothetical protein
MCFRHPGGCGYNICNNKKQKRSQPWQRPKEIMKHDSFQLWSVTMNKVYFRLLLFPFQILLYGQSRPSSIFRLFAMHFVSAKSQIPCSTSILDRHIYVRNNQGWCHLLASVIGMCRNNSKWTVTDSPLRLSLPIPSWLCLRKLHVVTNGEILNSWSCGDSILRCRYHVEPADHGSSCLFLLIVDSALSSTGEHRCALFLKNCNL